MFTRAAFIYVRPVINESLSNLTLNDDFGPHWFSFGREEK